jgi:hypothetical protein
MISPGVACPNCGCAASSRRPALEIFRGDLQLPLQAELLELSYAVFVHCYAELLEDPEAASAFMSRYRYLYELRHRTELESLCTLVSKDSLSDPGVPLVSPELVVVHQLVF